MSKTHILMLAAILVPSALAANRFCWGSVIVLCFVVSFYVDSSFAIIFIGAAVVL